MAKPQTTDEKLDIIVAILQKMDSRERWKMWGAFIRGTLSLIPVIILVLATWYTVVNADSLLKKITSMAAEQAGRVAQQNTGSLVDQFNQINKYLKK
ncbi:MAG: hypothetical protein PHE68_05115 [Candidatus Peribacteraceae bacterium]|nr:hypothetical protein [Candidatus Peribacteraceae bacterium]MDD5074889.1 hypothetical protein [Candidatus Peribacteraceae bacterium]